MNQLLFIEIFVLGAASIAAIYHLVLFIQQRDKFLLFYSAYLFSLVNYIIFKLVSNNYSPFLPTTNLWHYILEEVLQVCMVAVYALFAAQTLAVFGKRSIVRTLTICFFVLSFCSVIFHTTDALLYGPSAKSPVDYAISRISLVGVATLTLLFAWRIRTTIFQRTIIIGSLVYDCSGLLSIFSFTQYRSIFGLNGIEPYLVGCLLDIIIFSSALGYRLKTVADEKNNLLKKELENQKTMEKVRMGIASNLHDDLGSTLSSISIYSEAVKNSLNQNKPEKVLELIDKIGQNARETVSNMSDIVWAINPMNDNGDILFSRMETFASPLLASKNISLVFVIDKELQTANFKMAIRQNLFLIFKEVVINAAKYSEAKNISIVFSKSRLAICMHVKDDGKGFEPNQQKDGNGLRNMKVRAAELSGSLEINTSTSGTSVKLLFPAEFALENNNPLIR